MSFSKLFFPFLFSLYVKTFSEIFLLVNFQLTYEVTLECFMEKSCLVSYIVAKCLSYVIKK